MRFIFIKEINYFSTFHVLVFLRNIRHVKTPTIPRIKNKNAAPDPFPVPNTVAKNPPSGCNNINGPNTLSTNIPPEKYRIGIVKNCNVFLTE